jgi:SAM-dependent methyltransferase
MDINLIRDINTLWLPVYPGLARQVADLCTTTPRSILEVGCFSGGTGLELLKLFAHSKLTVAPGIPELAGSFYKDWPAATAQNSRITITATPLAPLDLPDNAFNLIFCRGVFFFLDAGEVLLAEMHRALAPGGICFAGGGFGTHTPQTVIEPIADESRRLNYALGKKLVALREFRELLRINALTADIIEDGGLWAAIQK